MSPLTTTRGRPATGTHRARIVADAVVSAYLNEINPTRHRSRALTEPGCVESSARTAARSPLGARTRGRPVPAWRRPGLPLRVRDELGRHPRPAETTA